MTRGNRDSTTAQLMDQLILIKYISFSSQNNITLTVKIQSMEDDRFGLLCPAKWNTNNSQDKIMKLNQFSKIFKTEQEFKVLPKQNMEVSMRNLFYDTISKHYYFSVHLFSSWFVNYRSCYELS